MRTSAKKNSGKGTARCRGPARRGNIIVMTAIMLVVMMAMIAFSVDIGYMYTMQAQLQRSVDAAALAGAGELVEGVDEAQAKAREYLVRNPVGSSISVVNENELDAAISDFIVDHGDNLDLQVGEWDPVTRTFIETDVLPSTLKVGMEYHNLPFFFARFLGKENFTIRAESTAMFQPRDIVLVLDLSASMNDDSEFQSISRLGRSEVEGNLLEIWQDLGSPTYGNLPFTPQWATAKGVPENTATGIPHIRVQYRYSSVYVTSTRNLTTVKLEFSNGAQQSFSPSSTTTGTFQGTGSNAGKQVTKVWVRSWNNNVLFGSSGEYFNYTSSGINTTLKKSLGLDTVPYPYPSGSWDEYINLVEYHAGSNYDAGYRYKFGGMNLLNYWMEWYPGANQIPDLWKTRAEPMQALKSSVDVFMDFIQSVDTNDRVGLAVYDAANGEGLLEIPLTNDVGTIAEAVRLRQAGHYHQYTNIGAGLHEARLHLDSTARPNAKKMIVLMTDGNANWRNGQYNETAANQYVIDEAALCAAEARKYPIMAISMGAGADSSVMQQAASMTEGSHFNVPGGSSQDAYYQQLYDVFEAIAKARPLKLVK